MPASRTARRGAVVPRPPIRTVSDAEVARHLPLVDFTLNRMIRRGEVAPSMEYEDLQAIGRWGAWEALRRYDPALGSPSTYLTAYIRGYVLDKQKRQTRGDGYGIRDGVYQQLATVVSYDHETRDSGTLLSRLAGPDDTSEQAIAAATLRDLLGRVARLPTSRHREIARALVLGEPVGTRERAAEHGVSPQALRQMGQGIAEWLAAGAPGNDVGILLVCRRQYRTRQAASIEAVRARPGCDIVALRALTIIDGKLTDDHHGDDGRPVWAVTVRAHRSPLTAAAA
jgi:RNA polymerase sigma factor (sigma-70 family)